MPRLVVVAFDLTAVVFDLPAVVFDLPAVVSDLPAVVSAPDCASCAKVTSIGDAVSNKK